MIIQHNLMTMNTNRHIGINTKKRTISMERFSSGYRINRAADNAAGLSISEKMRGQIRGLEQATHNIQDGLSLLQTADGAMNEIHAMLQRMRELSVQGANDTNVEADRQAIQKEIQQLSANIDDIGNYTEFNTIQVLKSGETQTLIQEIEHSDLPSIISLPSELTLGALAPDGVTTGQHSYAIIDFSSVNPSNIQDFADKGFFSTCCTCTEKYNIRFVGQDEPSTGTPNPVININITNITSGEEIVDKILNQGSSEMTHYTKMMKDPSDGNKLILYDERPNQPSDAAAGYGVLKPGYVETIVTHTQTGATNIIIQAGANSGQSIDMKLPNISILALGLTGLNVLDHINAEHGIDSVDKAISIISKERSYFGAIYNRLEHAFDNANNSVENLTASESRIRDLDMVKEMVEFAKLNILGDAADSILAQGMKSAEGVLALLR